MTEQAHNWRRHTVATPDLSLVYYVGGVADAAVPLVFINGGPGDNHRYMRPLAVQLTDAFSCVLYDQRGCGESTLNEYSADTLSIQKFVDDLEALRRALGVERLYLLGHSWGAMLALVYAAFYPTRVAAQILVGMGPLTPEMSGIALANTLKLLNMDERRDYERLSSERRAAISAGDEAKQAELHKTRTVTYTTRAWFYDPEVRARFNADWLATYTYNPQIVGLLMPTLHALDMLERVRGLAVKTLVIYGAQDYCPLMQAYLLRERMTHTEVALINECGHIPWLEKPAIFYSTVRGFLMG